MILVTLVFLPFYRCWIFLSMGCFSHLLVDSQSLTSLGEWCQETEDNIAIMSVKLQDKADREELAQISGNPQQDSGNSQNSGHSFLSKKEKWAHWCFQCWLSPRQCRDLCKPNILKLGGGDGHHDSGPPPKTLLAAPRLSSNQKAGSPTKFSRRQPPGFLLPAGLDQWRLVSGKPQGWSWELGVKGNCRDFASISPELSSYKINVYIKLLISKVGLRNTWHQISALTIVLINISFLLSDSWNVKSHKG